MSARSKESSRHKAYLKGLGLVMVVLLGGVAALNWSVDPYEVFGSPRREGFNRYKHGTRENARIAKVYMVERVQPRSIVVGSSRAEMAYDPAHSGLPQPGFNLSVEGAGIYEIRRLVQHALAVAPVEEVLVALDYFAFSADRESGRGFEETRLAVQADGTPTPRRHSDVVEALFSYSALKLSWKTLASARQRPGYIINEAGFREIWDDNRDILRKGGFRRAFVENEAVNATGYYGPAERPLRLRDDRRGVDTLLWFEQLVADCRVRGVRLHLLIFPVHARLQEVIRARGLWSHYAAWKKALTDIVAAQTPLIGWPAPPELWDFATLAAPNQEAVPPVGDTTTVMRYYREASHGTKALGDLVLDRVFHPANMESIPAHFGIRLTPENIAQELARQRSALDRWHAEHPGDVAEIAALLRQRGMTPQ